MKIDLDSMERVALAADKEEPNWTPDFSHGGGWACPGGNQVESFIVSADPKTTLALIARIRELEEVARAAVILVEASEKEPTYAHAMRRLVEKGAVLP